MRLTFLGTGSALPTGERVQAGLLLEDDGRSVLVDCGAGVLHQLARTSVGFEGVEALLLTHHHLDHVADLMPLLKARWLAGAETFEIAGPPGTTRLVEALFEVHDYLQDRVDLTLRDIGPGEVNVAGFAGRAMETRHSIRCHAYRLTGPDGDLTVSGDTEADPSLAEFADGSAVLVHDCSFPDDVDVSNHPTPTQLGEALAGHQFGVVYLTHLYPHTDGVHDEMLAAVATAYDGGVRFARDGLTVDV